MFVSRWGELRHFTFLVNKFIHTWRARRVIFVQQLIKTCLRLCDHITCFWEKENECCMLKNRPSNPVTEWSYSIVQWLNCKIQTLHPLLRKEIVLGFLFCFFIFMWLRWRLFIWYPLSGSNFIISALPKGR